MISYFTEKIIFSQIFLDIFSKRSFYPGKSLFFWVLVGMIFYIYYLYTKSKNKQEFFNSDYIRSISASIALFLCSFFIINLFFSNPKGSKIIVEKDEEVIPIEVQLEKDKELMEKSEIDFTNPYKHYEYISYHFTIPPNFVNPQGYHEDRDDYTILNYYKDKSLYTEKQYVDNAKFALGMISYKQDSLYKSYDYLSSISTKKFPIKNNYKALILLKLGDTLKAIHEYKLAAEIKDEFQDNAKNQVIILLTHLNLTEDLYALLHDTNYRNSFSYTLASKLYWLYSPIWLLA